MRLRVRRLVRYLAFICVLLLITMVFQRYIWPDESGEVPGAFGGADGGKLPRDRAILGGGEQNKPNSIGAERIGWVKKGDNKNYAASENDLQRIDWHDYTKIRADKQRTGHGEQGKGVQLTPELKSTQREDTKANGFNVHISDMVSLDRAIPDIRNARCKDVKYLAKLPNTSVVIPFHNEAMSTLQRTVHSVLNRSPEQLIHEILLVDDYSDRDFLKQPLEDYMARFSKVKIIRTGKREGLIRTRLLGGRKATGGVIVYLDSHCEANVNWLPPLLERIALNRRCIPCPMIDVIGNEDFHYESQAGDIMRGAFDWELYYKRIPINEAERKRRTHDSDPLKTPIMAGGLFAVDRKYFMEELGGYDDGLDVWGGEQYDLSFKVWMCGGEMEEVPCSRVGHVYRKFMSYSVPGGPGVINRNLMRVVETWMGEWKEHFYNHKPYLKGQQFGDISKQLALKERLQCKNFTWFLTEVAPDILKHYPPVEPDPGAKGYIKHIESGLCFTIVRSRKTEFKLQTCVDHLMKPGGNQYFRLSWHDDLRIGSDKSKDCLDFPHYQAGTEPIIYPCHGGRGNQLWTYNQDYKLLYHPVSRMCLATDSNTAASDKSHSIVMAHCSRTDTTQKFEFETPNSKKLLKLNKENPIDFAR